MRLRLQKLEEANSKTQGLKQKKTDSYEKINKIHYHQGLPFVPKTI